MSLNSFMVYVDHHFSNSYGPENLANIPLLDVLKEEIDEQSVSTNSCLDAALAKDAKDS